VCKQSGGESDCERGSVVQLFKVVSLCGFFCELESWTLNVCERQDK
jgi:hypothetical protein